MRIDLDDLAEIVGDDANATVNKCLKIVQTTTMPLYMTGPSGCGKTHIAMTVAKKYAEKIGDIGVRYVQLSPDVTKTSLILGLRIVDGTLKPVHGMIAEAMEEGDIVVIDEATHGSQEILLMLNSVIDKAGVSSIGDDIVFAADTFRIIFCANASSYSGNVKLPQAFARRLIPVTMDYPSYKTEVEIVNTMLEAESPKVFEQVPKSLIRYLVSIMRDFRSYDFPLTVTNVIGAIYLMNATETLKKRSLPAEDAMREMLNSRNAEAKIKSTYAMVNNGSTETNVVRMKSNSELNELMRFVNSIGIKAFNDCVKDAMMYNLDIDGMKHSTRETKDKLAASLF